MQSGKQLPTQAEVPLRLNKKTLTGVLIEQCCGGESRIAHHIDKRQQCYSNFVTAVAVAQIGGNVGDAGVAMDAKETFRALVEYIRQLDAMERALIRAVTDEREVPNFRDVLEEVGNAAAEMKKVLYHYQGQRLPAEIENCCQHLLSGIKTCSAALVMYSIFLNFKTGSP